MTFRVLKRASGKAALLAVLCALLLGPGSASADKTSVVVTVSARVVESCHLSVRTSPAGIHFHARCSPGTRANVGTSALPATAEAALVPLSQVQTTADGSILVVDF